MILAPRHRAFGADAPAASPGPAKIKIALVGDSTVTDTAGWGKGFAACLKENAECLNFSKGGRSSKSFIVEGSWKPALDSKPDYVLIQFGHNDQPGKPGRSTDLPTYRQCMTQYVDDARAAGIKPVLVTSLSRREWGADGKIHSSLQPWADIVKEIAAQKNVPLIDLHARSIEFYEKQGREKLFEISPIKDADAKSSPIYAAPGDHKVYDGTHLNAKGSEIIGPIVAGELKTAVPELAPCIR